uniref:Uncharacterized protein n=1 Tax=Quercus lobata TaxID=97700 RepID=A0A7N2N476_QUELO
MNFLVDKLGRPSTDIARNPVVLHLNLEKRIIPRCSVIQILIARDLVKDDLSFSSFLLVNEKSFLKKYVSKFQDYVPQLLSLYQNKMDLLDVEIQFEKVDLHISKPLALALIFSSINLLCGPLKHSAMCTIASNLKCRQVSAEKDLKKQPEMHFGCVIQMDYTSPGADIRLMAMMVSGSWAESDCF